MPLSFGFSYMMIHLAKEAERKAKLAKDKGPKKVATINLSEKMDKLGNHCINCILGVP